MLLGEGGGVDEIKPCPSMEAITPPTHTHTYTYTNTHSIRRAELEKATAARVALAAQQAAVRVASLARLADRAAAVDDLVSRR